MSTQEATQEATQEPLLGEGDIVQFEILSAEHTRARSSGAEMLALKLRVTNEEGAVAVMRERVMLDRAGRLAAFLRAIGREIGQMQSPASWTGVKGFATLGYEAARGEWPAKWRIHRWGTGNGDDPVSECRPRPVSGDPITRAERTGMVVEAAAVAVLSGKALPLQPIEKTHREQEAAPSSMGSMLMGMGRWAVANGVEMPEHLPHAQLVAEFKTGTGWAQLRPANTQTRLVGALPGMDEVPS